MKRILALLAFGFASSSGKTKEFTEFARKFKIAFENEIDKANGMLVSYSVGHFYVSGFFRLATGQLIYFALPDVRNWMANRPDTFYGSLLWRTATNEKDFTGGRNRKIQLHDGMVTAIENQAYMDEKKISFLVIGDNKKVKRSGILFII
jgi:hypothetical protein